MEYFQPCHLGIWHQLVFSLNGVFRNYSPPNVLLGYPLDSKYFKPPNAPEAEYMWFAAQASAAAPTYFKSQGVYCDGGLVANNPTLDLLTELWEWNVALRGSHNPKHRILSPTLVVSLGTGLNIMEQHMDKLDIEFPDSVGAFLKTVNNLRTLLKHVIELSTCTDFQVIPFSFLKNFVPQMVKL